MKLINSEKLLLVIEQIHGVESWQALGVACPKVLDDLIGVVDKHCENIYQKLGMENRVAAAREWLSSQ